jgi:integrase
LNGLRVSEALTVDASDRGLERGHCTLTVTGKGGTRTVVPLAPRTCDALDASLAGRTTGPLFVTRTGARLDRHAAAKIVQRVARLAGITKHLSPHSLRHSAITAALDAGVPLRDVQDFARHADPRTTRRYDRGRHSLDRHATYRIASFLAEETS